MTLLEIARSWYRATIHTPEQQALAEERLAKCHVCPACVFQEQLKYFKCTACGCPISKKVYTAVGGMTCPLGRWER